MVGRKKTNVIAIALLSIVAPFLTKRDTKPGLSRETANENSSNMIFTSQKGAESACGSWRGLGRRVFLERLRLGAPREKPIWKTIARPIMISQIHFSGHHAAGDDLEEKKGREREKKLYMVRTILRRLALSIRTLVQPTTPVPSH
ncbi:hypothetical protein C8R43DRAFT_1002809, partial [Mycena crocata]